MNTTMIISMYVNILIILYIIYYILYIYIMYLSARQLLIKHDLAKKCQKQLWRPPAAVFEMCLKSDDKGSNKSTAMCYLDSLVSLSADMAFEIYLLCYAGTMIRSVCSL